MTSKNFKELLDKFEIAQTETDNIAIQLSKTCTSALDDFVTNLASSLGKKNLTNEELDFYILNLPIYIYYASVELERLGLNEDISAMTKKERIIKTLESSTFKGTAQNKSISAEIENADSVLINMIYSRAYKIAKSKLDCAYEVLASCKKVMSRRIEELKAFTSDTKQSTEYFSRG